MKTRRRPLRMLISAGPTREKIDPVRFISNASTGTAGYYLAQAAQKQGHNVILLSGPVSLKPPAGVMVKHFESALELRKLSRQYLPWADAVIFAAAVGDYHPLKIYKHKLKKNKRIHDLKLIRNPDILGELSRKKADKIMVGFALETDNLLKNAALKRKKKNLDLIVANKLSARQNPFGPGNLSAVLISASEIRHYKEISKKLLARIIIDRVEQLCYT